VRTRGIEFIDENGELRRAAAEKQDRIEVTGPMLKVGIPLLLAAVSVALLAPKKVRNALGVLGIVGILAALWAIGILVVVLINLPVPQ
jgi:hypothetical protein